jgi:putative DNA primase/helicase
MPQILNDFHRQQLTHGSGIASEIIAERGYCSLDHPGDVQDLGFSKAQARTAPVLAIPLWNVHRQQTGWQIRPNSPRQFKNGSIPKYEHPKGSHLILDVHPRLQPLLGDPTQPLWVTEGIKKADCLASRGLCTIALNGVWGFKGSNEHGGKVILPDWEHVALNGRRVYVVFDSDIYVKKGVEAALKAFYAFLRGRQAIPCLVQWPEEYRQSKIGVDDFLVQGHTIADLFAMVPPIGPLPSKPPRPEPQSNATDEDYPYSDAFNALRLVQAHRQEMRYCSAWKAWLTWTGTHWQRDTTGQLVRWQRETVKALGADLPGLGDDDTNKLLLHIKASLQTPRLEAAVRQAQSWEGISIAPACFDADPWVLNCLNGTLDLKTGNLRPHQPTDLITKCLPIAYDPEAHCPQWIAFLEKVMQGNAELIVFLQRALGYSLTGSTQEQCFFLLHGRTKTGKSTFMHIAKALLGPYGTQAEMSTFLHKDRETVRNDLADLAGMRLVCAIETDEGKRLAEALIKQLTGGTDTIKARFLFEEYFEYRPQFKVFLATNHKPKVNPSDDAIWERIRLIPFAVQIPQDDRDKTLETKLRDELPGILAWAGRGCRAWQNQHGLGEPVAVVEATAGYREEMDTLAHFLDECCTTGDPEYVKVKATALASAYHAWCKRTSTLPLANLAFIAALETRQYLRKRGTGNQYYWHGLGLLDTGDERAEPHEKDAGV